MPTALSRPRRKVALLSATAAVGALALAATSAVPAGTSPTGLGLLSRVAQERLHPSPGEAGQESHEAATAAQQFDEARTAPGIVAPGAYGAAYRQLTALPTTGGSWAEQTNVPYESDDPYFRDYYSNSGTGDRYVTGRITGVAADDAGHVYAAGADGGVWRSVTPGGGAAPADHSAPQPARAGRGWAPMADRLPSLSSGALSLNGSQLWYATGEANTGGTSYVGSGVYALTNPQTTDFTPASRVGGSELESTTINSVRFAGDWAWVSTNRGIWSHSTDLVNHRTDPWTFEFAPNLDWMPRITDDNGNVLVPAGSKWSGNIGSGTTNAAYKNIVNDLVIDPKDPRHVVANIAWRSGDDYNGFYELRGVGKGKKKDDDKKGKKGSDAGTWRKINPLGQIKPGDIGNATFAFAKDSSKLYVVLESPSKLQSGADSVLEGIYVSKKGKVQGPWQLIADSDVLAASGSALDSPGYRPGVQAWYNQFAVVDPANPDHLYVGLEEVYETRDGGKHWTTPGPYWNFPFACWAQNYPDGYKTETVGCPSTTHPDQHAAAIGTVNGVPTFFAANDGGVYSRPVNGSADASGHATDWKSLNDGSIDALQYYGIGVGAAKASTIAGLPDQQSQQYPTTGPILSGGLQDNGGSITFSNGRMSSNFGGDGGDVLVDPTDGCNIVQEYVFLSMEVTNTCAQASELENFIDTSKAHTRSIDPGDPSPRFIAPFGADQLTAKHWVAGGEYVWAQGNGFDIQSGAEWTPVADTGAGHSTTALASSGDVVYAGWCGPCNNNGFTRGLTRVSVEYTADGPVGTQTEVVLPGSDAIPNRYIGGVAIDPRDNSHVFLAINGFSRRFTEGPGVGLGHVYESTDGGVTWKDVSDNLPDVPASSIKVTTSGALVLGTDLGAFYRAPGAAKWAVLGSNLPLTVVMDVELYHGDVYVGTHGRGIWKIAIPDGSQSPYAPDPATTGTPGGSAAAASTGPAATSAAKKNSKR